MKLIPTENKIDTSDVFKSMIFMSVILYYKGDFKKACLFLQNIVALVDMRDAREWECFEFSYFLYLYFNDVSSVGEDSYYYLRGYKKKLFNYYKINKKGFLEFYNRLPYKDVRKNVKGYLKRRWDKTELKRGYAIIKDAQKGKNIEEEWVGVVISFLEAVFLMYVVGNVNIDEVKLIEERIKMILSKNNREIKLAPFVDFYL